MDKETSDTITALVQVSLNLNSRVESLEMWITIVGAVAFAAMAVCYILSWKLRSLMPKAESE